MSYRTAVGTLFVLTFLAGLQHASAQTGSSYAQQEHQAVVQALYKFVAAGRSGRPQAIAATVSQAMIPAIWKRTKWASGAGMDLYQDFARRLVQASDIEITGERARVIVHLRASGWTTNARGDRIDYNRQEGYILLRKENGIWKVSGFNDTLRVWRE